MSIYHSVYEIRAFKLSIIAYKVGVLILPDIITIL